jgi:predicted GNAT family acetyltransferase
MSERMYKLTEVTPPAGVPGYLRQANEGDTELLARWLREFHNEATPNQPGRDPTQVAQQKIQEGAFFIWDDGNPVSLAGSTRPTVRGISVGPVYTPPGLRRRGYASACVAALSQRLLDQGYEYCTLFTDLANPTSNDIYQQVGYRPVCDFLEILFTPAE